MIEMLKWRKDKETVSVDRWILPLKKIAKRATCIDFQYDAYGGRDFLLIDRSFVWLERHTYLDKPTQDDLDDASVIVFIFEEM